MKKNNNKTNNNLGGNAERGTPAGGKKIMNPQTAPGLFTEQPDIAAEMESDWLHPILELDTWTQVLLA